MAGPWHLEILIPAWRIVFAVQNGEIVELRGATTQGTFGAYRKLPESVPGMIAWPNTVLLTGPETLVIDPGYQTQGDMLEGALDARGLAPDDVTTVAMTHLHSDHVTALPQLGEVEMHVHENELPEPYAENLRGVRDRARIAPLRGASGEVRPGLRWMHTPGHSPGHVSFVVDTDQGTAVVAGDTLGPDPSWFAAMDLPEGFPDRAEHLAAFAKIRAEAPALVIPGHTVPVRI